MAKLKKLLLSGLATSAALGMLFASDATVAQAAEGTGDNSPAETEGKYEPTPNPGTEPIENPSDGNAGTGENDPNPAGKEVDKAELDAAIKKAEEAKNTVKYEKATASVKQQFDDMLKQAKEASESEDSEKAQIDDLTKKLNDATEKLDGKEEPAESGEGDTNPEEPGEGAKTDWSQYKLAAKKDPNNPLKKPAGKKMDFKADQLADWIMDGNLDNKGPEFEKIKDQIQFEIVKNLPDESTAGKEYPVIIKATFPDNTTQEVTLQVLVTAEEEPETPEQEEFTVTFHQNYENKVNVTRKVKKDQKTTYLDLNREGYKLVGWYTDEEMTQKFDFDTPITADLDLYAKWEKEDAEVNKAALTEAITAADAAKKTAKYQKATEEKKNNFDKAYEKAKEVEADETAKQEAIDQAAEELVTATTALDGKEETIAAQFDDKILIGKDLTKKQGEKVAVEDVRKAITQPVGMTDDEWEAAVNGLEIMKNLEGNEEVGDHTVKVKLTFSDKSAVEKDIPVKVEAKEGEETEDKELEAAKTAAKAEIAKLGLADDKVTEFNGRVDAAETVDAVKAVVDEAKAAKEAQDAEAAEKALQDAKKDAKAEIAKLGLADDKVTEFNGRVDAAETVDAVNAVVAAAKKEAEKPDEKTMADEYKNSIKVTPIKIEFEGKVTEEAILKAVTVEGLERKEPTRAAEDKWYSVALAEGQELPDGKTAGTFRINVVVTFSDGSTTEKTVDVTVKEKVEEPGEGNEGQKPGTGNGEETDTPEDKALALEVKELDKWVKYADSLKKMTIDVHNALDEAKAVLAKEGKTYAEVHKALEKLFFALEDADLLPKTGDEGQTPGEGSGEETPNKPGKDWNDLIDWDKLEDLLGKGEEGQKPGTGGQETEKPGQGNEGEKPGTGGQETEKPGQGNEGEKPGTGGQETEKPAKDWLELIDWNKLKELLAKKGDKKPGKQEEVKTGKKEEAKKGKKEEAKKLPQTGAVASLGSAALGLALTTLGAGFAFRKRQ